MTIEKVHPETFKALVDLYTKYGSDKLREFFDLLEKGFSTIDTRDNGFYHTVKYLDVTEFSLGYCYNCKDFQPMKFEAQEQIPGKQNGGIFVTCDECGKYHRSWDLSHMNNDRS